MLKPNGQLIEAIPLRKSRRSFLDKAVRTEDFQVIADMAAQINTNEPDLRIVVKPDSADGIFTGRIGYGVISAKRAFAAIISKNSSVQTAVKAGYYGEWMILEATRRGLATCWVGGTFNRASAELLLKLAPGEALLAVTPLGEAYPNKTPKEKTMSFLAGSANRKQLTDIITDDASAWTGWMKKAAEAVQKGPSAMNAQPWRLSREGNAIIVSIDPKMAKRAMSLLDCGIAMCHISVVAAAEGVVGEWSFLELPEIAIFRPNAIGGT